MSVRVAFIIAITITVCASASAESCAQYLTFQGLAYRPVAEALIQLQDRKVPDLSLDDSAALNKLSEDQKQDLYETLSLRQIFEAEAKREDGIFAKGNEELMKDALNKAELRKRFSKGFQRAAYNYTTTKAAVHMGQVVRFGELNPDVPFRSYNVIGDVNGLDVSDTHDQFIVQNVGAVRIVDMSSGKVKDHIFHEPIAYAGYIEWGKKILIVGESGKIQILDSLTQEVTLASQLGPGKGIYYGVAVNNASRTFSVLNSGEAKMIDWRTLEVHRIFERKRPDVESTLDGFRTYGKVVNDQRRQKEISESIIVPIEKGIAKFNVSATGDQIYIVFTDFTMETYDMLPILDINETGTDLMVVP